MEILSRRVCLCACGRSDIPLGPWGLTSWLVSVSVERMWFICHSWTWLVWSHSLPACVCVCVVGITGGRWVKGLLHIVEEESRRAGSRTTFSPGGVAHTIIQHHRENVHGCPACSPTIIPSSWDGAVESPHHGRRYVRSFFQDALKRTEWLNRGGRAKVGFVFSTFLSEELVGGCLFRNISSQVLPWLGVRGKACIGVEEDSSDGMGFASNHTVTGDWREILIRTDHHWPITT